MRRQSPSEVFMKPAKVRSSKSLKERVADEAVRAHSSHKNKLLLSSIRRNGDGDRQFTVLLVNGHFVRVTITDGWLRLDADSTMTVRPVNEASIYIRPVGYVGPWIPEFAARPLGEWKSWSVQRREAIQRAAIQKGARR